MINWVKNVIACSRICEPGPGIYFEIADVIIPFNIIVDTIGALYSVLEA